MAQIIKMVRDPAMYPPPHTANIHESNVSECLKAGWKIVEEEAALPATFPEGFPGFISLQLAGFTSPAELVGKTLEELRGIPGVGPVTAKQILARLA